MIVRCSNCQTQFSLDDRQVGPDGAPVRCSVCAYVFRVEPPAGAAPLPWQVRTVDELVFSATDLGTLRGWISEGRLHPDDRISRTGKHWIRLGDMPEFSEAFAGFNDLPEVLSPVGGPADPGADLGPPPDFAGGSDDGVVERVPEDASQSIDVSGLLDPMPGGDDEDDDVADEEPTVARPLPEEETDTVVHREAEEPQLHEAATGFRGTGGTARVHRDDVEKVLSRMEDSGAVTLPPPPPPPPGAVRTKREMPTPPELATDSASGMPVLEPDVDLDAAESLEAEIIDEGVPATTVPAVEETGTPSLLVAVTEHVKPITSTSEGSGASEASESSRPLPREPTVPEPSVPERPPHRKRSSWPLVAGLGLLCGAAVVFGVPQVRERVVGFAGTLVGVEPKTDTPPAAVASAGEAIAAGEPKQLDEAAASLREALQGDLSPKSRVATQLTLVEVLSTRALVLQLQVGLEGDGSSVKFAAADAAEEAGQVFAGTDVAQADSAAVGRARARLRLAQGRPVDEVLSEVPADDAELKWLVTAGPMFRDPQARVPSGLIGGLSGLSEPSVPARLVLALAYVRGGDTAGASGALQEIPEHPVAVLLQAKLSRPEPEPEPETKEEPEPETKEEPEPEPETKEEPDAVTITEDPKPVGSGLSVDGMIKRGCSLVDKGQAKEGLKYLLKAFDRRPSDIDVLVCMADAHRKQGSYGSALSYYKKALSRSPRYSPALIGAARAASRKAKKDEAVTYYRRLLAVQPGNGEAKAYIAKHQADKTKPTPTPTPTPKPGTPSTKPPPPSANKDKDPKAPPSP